QRAQQGLEIGGRDVARRRMAVAVRSRLGREFRGFAAAARFDLLRHQPVPDAIPRWIARIESKAKCVQLLVFNQLLAILPPAGPPPTLSVPPIAVLPTANRPNVRSARMVPKN